MENNKLNLLFIGILVLLVWITASKYEDYNLIKSKYDLIEKHSKLQFNKHIQEIDSLNAINDSLDKRIQLNIYYSDSIRNTIDSILNNKPYINAKDIAKINSVKSWNDSIRNKFWTEEFARKDTLLPTKKTSLQRR